MLTSKSILIFWSVRCDFQISKTKEFSCKRNDTIAATASTTQHAKVSTETLSPSQRETEARLEDGSTTPLWTPLQTELLFGVVLGLHLRYKDKLSLSVALNEALASFLAVANDRSNKHPHGKWVPARCWSFLAKKKLQFNGRMSQKKVIKALHPCIGASLDGNNHAGSIVWIRLSDKKTLHRRDSTVQASSKKKQQCFLMVENKLTILDGDPTNAMTEAQKTTFLQSSCFNHAELMNGRSRRSSVGMHCRMESAQSDDDEPQNTQQPRPVTPAPRAIDQDCNADIKALLTGVINPTHPAKEDSFVDPESSCETLRSRSEDLGIKLQTEKNPQMCEALSTEGATDLSSLAATQTHKVLLHGHCLPKHKRAIQAVLLHALAAHEEDSSIGMFQLPRLEGGKQRAGPRPMSVTPSNERNLQTDGRRWLPKLHQAMAPDLSVCACSCQLMPMIRHHSKPAFDAACTAGGPRERPQMDPHRQIAMCHKLNITTRTLREMRPFLSADDCNPFLSERVTKRHEVSPSIKAITSTVMEKKMKRVASHLPPDQVAIEAMNGKHEAHPMDEAHVMWSGDHGQGAFRSNATIVGVSQNDCKCEKHASAGQIDCKQDTRQVLNDSGAIAGIDDGLKRLLSASPMCLPTENGAPPPPATPIKLKATGDLAFCSLIVKGNSKMAGHHCWRCLARWTEFQKDPFCKGEKLTLASLKDRCNELESGELSRKNKDHERGIKTLPLVDCIEPADWMCPALHAVDSLVNKVCDCLQMWTWCRLEDVPVESIAARFEWAESTTLLEGPLEKQETAEAHLEAMQSELDSLEFDGSVPGDDDCEFQHDTVTVAEDDLRDVCVDAEEAEKTLKKAKARLNELEKNKKKYGRATQDLWMKPQNKLRDSCNIHVSSCHGGDMEGPECRRPLKEADEVMDVVESMLLEHWESLSNDEKKGKANEDEIRLLCSAFKRLFQCMGLLCHHCCQRCGSLTDEDIVDVEKVIVLAIKLWQRSMPAIPMKVHAWLHLLEDLKALRGMLNHDEHGIERAHQRGKREAIRLRAHSRDAEKKTHHTLKREATLDSSEVQSMLRDTEAQRKRHKKRSAPPRAEDRAFCLRGMLLLPEIEDEFPTILESQQAVASLEEAEAE